MYFKNPSKEITHEAEIRAYRRDSFAVSHMVKAESVDPDEQGNKIVPVGTLVDKDGAVCKITEGEISGTPVGITRHAVDVTNGNEPVAIYTRAHLNGPLLNMWGQEYSDDIGTKIETALPEIHIYPRPPKAAAGAGGGGSSVSFPITVAQGGTGATDTETARTNLEVDSKTNTDATKATAEAAKATAEQNKTDIQSLTERVTTLEG